MTEDQQRFYFQKIFLSPEGSKVLAALAEFARADEAEYCADPRKDAYFQGRRSVILFIRNSIKEVSNGE